MRIATVHQRANLIVGTGAVDIHEASGGRFGPGAAGLYERWARLADWAAAATLPDPEPYAPGSLGSPSPTPRQVSGIGLNYGAHAAESGFARPETAPPVFTKFPSCITGPYGEVLLPADGHTDWEVELVVVIGRSASHVSAADARRCVAGARRYVAGLSVGQHLSGRVLQMAATPPQFSLGKSYPRFGPVVRGSSLSTTSTTWTTSKSAARSTATSSSPARRRTSGWAVPAALACPWRRADQLYRGHRRDAPPFRRRPAPLRRTP